MTLAVVGLVALSVGAHLLTIVVLSRRLADMDQRVAAFEALIKR